MYCFCVGGVVEFVDGVIWCFFYLYYYCFVWWLFGYDFWGGWFDGCGYCGFGCLVWCIIFFGDGGVVGCDYVVFWCVVVG